MSLQTYTNELLKLEEEGKIMVEEKRILFAIFIIAEKGLVTSIQKLLEQTEYARAIS